MDQFEYYRNSGTHPFTGVFGVEFKARVSEKESVKKYFDGTPHYEQIKGVTPGKVYDIQKVEGFGDVADFIFKDDEGNEARMGNFFFEDVKGVRYYSTQRPPGLGTFPKPKGNKVLEVRAFDDRAYIEEINRQAWGWVEYEQELTEKEAADYELVRETKEEHVMSESTKGKMTEDEFMNLSKAVLPHLRTLVQIAQDFGLGDAILSVAASADGYISFHTHNDPDWELVQIGGDKPVIRYRKQKYLDGEE